MKFSNYIFFALFFIVLLFSCKDKEPMDEVQQASGITSDLLSFLDSIPEQKYDSTDLLSEVIPTIYGAWKLNSTSGSITGSGYPLDFDYLLIKPNSIFGIVQDSALITTGHIELIDNPYDVVMINFVSEAEPGSIDVNLMKETVKAVFVTADSMSLTSYNPDGYNEFLIREE